MHEEEYRLEYSEKKGLFHYGDIEIKITNGLDYHSICDKLSYHQCNEFTERMYNKYPNMGEDEKNPSIENIKKEFEEFLLS